tara:strand:+ start:142 stop:405 length:264 start_codon:yes stop_codon:yes gene_type:complete
MTATKARIDFVVKVGISIERDWYTTRRYWSHVPRVGDVVMLNQHNDRQEKETFVVQMVKWGLEIFDPWDRYNAGLQEIEIWVQPSDT